MEDEVKKVLARRCRLACRSRLSALVTAGRSARPAERSGDCQQAIRVPRSGHGARRRWYMPRATVGRSARRASHALPHGAYERDRRAAGG